MNSYLHKGIIKRALTIITFFIMMPAYGMMSRLRTGFQKVQQAASARTNALPQISRATKAQIMVAGGCSIAAAGCLSAHANIQKEVYAPILKSEETKKRVILLGNNIPSNDSITTMFLYHQQHEDFLIKKRGILPALKNVPVLVLDVSTEFETNEVLLKECAEKIYDFMLLTSRR